MDRNDTTQTIDRNLLASIIETEHAMRGRVEAEYARRRAAVRELVVTDSDVIESIDDVDADEWGISHTREADASYVALVRGTGGAAVARVVEDSWGYRAAA